MIKNQKGIALLETLLILLILTIIGFGGYYVWNSQKQSDKSLSSAEKASQPTPVSNSNSASKKTLTIEEWGVKATYSSSVSLKYVLRDGDNNVAETSSQELDSAGCPNGGGLIARYTSNQAANEPGGHGMTASAFAKTLNTGEYGHVGDYYFFFEHSQFGCGDNGSSILQVQQETNDAAKNLLPDLQTSS
jgi:hypothetical protein